MNYMKKCKVHSTACYYMLTLGNHVTGLKVNHFIVSMVTVSSIDIL